MSNNLIAALLAFCFFFSSMTAAQTELRIPAPPYLAKPASAHWKESTSEQTSAGQDRIVRTEYWMRGNDYKQVATYASGRNVTLISIAGYGIYSDSAQEGSISYLSALNANASEEQKFANGYENIFQLLSWISEKTFVRAGSYKGREIFLYERTLVPNHEDQEPVRCSAYIDAETRLPVACVFGTRIYSFDELECNVPIPESTFAIPPQVAPLWEEHQKKLAHQEKLRRINSRAQ